MIGLLYFADLAGVAVFAISGALAAARRQMDIFGFIVVALAPAIGGGTVRDLLLDTPVFWIVDPAALYVAIVAGAATYFSANLLNSRYQALLWADAFGMALFSIIGASKAATLGAPFIVATAMGVMTAVMGGIIRDILCGEIPLIFCREIYAIPAALGSVAYLGGIALGYTNPTAAIAGFLIALIIRAMAIRRGWSLPVFSRPPQ